MCIRDRNWVVQPGLIVLRLIGAQLLVILIHRLGNHIKMHPLGSFGLQIHEIRQAFRAGIGKPFINGYAIAGGLGDLLPIFIQEQLIAEMLRRRMPQNTTNFIIYWGVGGVILAIHLKIHLQGGPARTKIRFPL